MARRKKEPRSVHRETIASAASVLFMERGITATSMVLSGKLNDAPSGRLF